MAKEHGTVQEQNVRSKGAAEMQAVLLSKASLLFQQQTYS